MGKMIHLRPIGYRSKARARRSDVPRVEWNWRYFWISVVVSAAMWLALVHGAHWLYVRVG